MTPSDRLSAAIEVLERILGGMPAEQALTNWGRASRFAGSGDRNAVRDLVYDALRCKRSHAAMALIPPRAEIFCKHMTPTVSIPPV